jgi:fumarylpyruvate hydrolase
MSESGGRAAGARLRAAADSLLAEVEPLPPDLVTWQPAADVWSVMDVLCHVHEFIPYWTRQTLNVIAEPREAWGRTLTDADRLGAVTNTSARRLGDVVQGIRAAAADSAETLSRLSDSDLEIEAPSRNPRWGVRPAHLIVDEMLVGHVEKHVGQIRRNVRLYQERIETMSNWVFPPPSQAAAPVRGRAERFPIRRIFCVGRNYAAHAREMGHAPDRAAPFYFMKASEHVVASGSAIPYPPGTNNCHHEVELVVAIGKEGFRIDEARALDHVFGYACGLDMTRRDLQSASKDKQLPWDTGKNFEQSAVLGDIAPASDIGHPSKGHVELRVNGQPRQAGDLSDLIHSVSAVIANLSQYYHLRPGDLIYTGTPEGVGPVKAGDRLEGSIEGVGTIALHVGDPL